MDVVSGIAAAGNALGIAKALRDVERSYDAATYKRQVVDLIDALTDAKIALSDARDELSKRNEEIERLKSVGLQRNSLVAGNGGYSYLVNETGERVGYPICPKCISTDNKIVKIVRNGAVHVAKCPVCSNDYVPVTSYIPPSENGGSETTDQERYRQAQIEKRTRENNAIARVNRGSWMSR